MDREIELFVLDFIKKMLNGLHLAHQEWRY